MTVQALLFIAGSNQPVLIVCEQCELLDQVPAWDHVPILDALDDLIVNDELRLDVLMHHNGGLGRDLYLLLAELRP